MDKDLLWKLLDSIQSQIKSFDTKSQVAIGVDSLIAGLIGSEVAKAVEYGASGMEIRFAFFLALSVLSIGFAVLSFFFALRAIHPRLHLNQPKSHFFFCHLVEKYQRHYNKAASALSSLTEETLKHEIATQIQTVAIICDAKANRCKRALICSGLALAIYLLSLAPLSSMAYDMATQTIAAHGSVASHDAVK